MARGKGGNRESSRGKIMANAAVGAEPKMAAPKVDFDGPYGSDTAQAPLQDARTSPSAPSVAPSAAPSRPPMTPRAVTPLDAPDDRPWEPVTTGLPMGPGAGPETQNLEKMRPFLPVLELIASRSDAGKDARNFVRRLRGALGATTARPQPQQVPGLPEAPAER